MSQKTFYITTPIYYANDKPHIGHAYTTLLADVLTRYHRLLGYDTYFLTGTDEHGQKVQQAAGERGVTPQAQVDEFHKRFKDLWEKLDIQYDRFIRTTDKDHREHVQRCLQELYDRGEIYLEEYEGWYSVGEERFYTDDELVDGKDPVSGRPVEWIKERNYFFRMGKYRDRLIQHIEDNPDFIQPDFRRNEVLGFLRQDLNDLCISRPTSRLSWGIPLPFDEGFVTYVWFDALLNYETGVLGFQFPDGKEAWPADYHVIGKDILTTHSVYWPTMLMGMGHELPRHIFAHGWWLTKSTDEGVESTDGEKMSKSKGNVVDPLAYAEQYGVDATRFFLMRDMVLGKDATFTHELFVTRVNTDLANDLGNAVNRINKFVHSKCGGVLPEPGELTAAETELRELATHAKDKTIDLIQNIKLSFALEEISLLVRGVNKYLEGRAPWHVAKNVKDDGSPESEAARAELGTILYTAGEALRIALSLLYPVMPGKVPVGLGMLGAPGEPDMARLEWGFLKGGETLTKSDALFPRIMDENEKQPRKPAQDGVQGSQVGGKPKQPKQKGQPDAPRDPATVLDFRVARIKTVADHPDADALFMLTVEDGEGERTVCAGLKSSYEAAELQDKKVVLLANLKPAKLRGVESKGMLLAGGGSTGKAVLLDPGDIPLGTTLAFGDVPVTPKSKVGSKDFAKIEPFVKGGNVYYGDHILGHAGTPVTCDAPDGSEVR